ncbi:hypothetical protein [Microbacterium sp. ISL-103]|uniref:hypothetical protein n=1 Tax=Microbacterium sp. ISL-103 TaxID=2819156 RepID=UPI0020359801|nr:hypothetical protein [Microbacterium sp. ISL-103]
MIDRLPLTAVLRHPLASAGSRESAALLVGAVTLIIGSAVALLAFWGGTMPISGPGSIGQFAAIGAAITAIVVFVAARSLARVQPATGASPARMRWFDIAALAIAHGIIALLGWIAIADIVERSFVGAVVFTFAGAVLAGAAMACTAYLVALSAANMSPGMLSVVLMLFLVVGAFASMLSASDEEWWKLHLSSLGVTDDVSALTFNITLIIAGVIVTTVAHFGTASIPAHSARAARGRRIVRLELTAMGVLLAGVGLFPVDRFLALRQGAFSNPSSYFNVFAHLTDDEAITTALGYWNEINMPNLVENVMPTKHRARLVLNKGVDHSVESVLLRKL